MPAKIEKAKFINHFEAYVEPMTTPTNEPVVNIYDANGPLSVISFIPEGAQWLSGRVSDSRPRGRGFEPHRHHCVVSMSKTHLSLLSTGPVLT